MKYILTPYSSQPSKNKSGTIRELNPSQFKPGQYNHQDPQLILNHPNIRIICDCCQKNVTILCHITSDDYDYCVGCFSQLEEFPEEYSVRSSMIYSLTDPEWLCLDQILLLTAFQKWGFGNWGEVKDFMNFNGAKFNKNEIQEHYDRYFLESDDLNPLVNSQVLGLSKEGLAREAKRFKKFSDHRERRTIMQMKSEQILVPIKKAAPVKNNILGYNSKRKCFYYDLQYDEKAQTMLADLQFKDDDTPEEMQLKFNIIANYNDRLNQRQKRYQFTIEHHLLDMDYRSNMELFANKSKKDAFSLFKPFLRFQSHEENEKIIEAITRNNQHQSLIQGLKQCRKKIDKQGRIQSTLNYIKSKKKINGEEEIMNLRKIYHVELEQSETVTEQTLRKFQQSMSRADQDKQKSHHLKIIYQSSRMP